MSNLKAILCGLLTLCQLLHRIFLNFTPRVATTIGVLSFLLALAVSESDWHTATSIGFGALDPRAIIRYGVRGVLANTFIANSAQLIVSLIYFSYNSLFTAMLLGYEWTTYAYKQKGLRVTTKARGAQRSSYFLSLPYRFALPLMATSGLMHWVVSQSIFFIIIEVSIALSDPGFMLTKMRRPALCMTIQPSSTPYSQLDTLPSRW